jgi:hypothetical protein
MDEITDWTDEHTRWIDGDSGLWLETILPLMGSGAVLEVIINTDGTFAFRRGLVEARGDLPPAPTPKDGHVYFYLSAGTPYVYIGQTTNLAQRLSAHRSHHPQGMELLLALTTSAPVSLEAYFHKTFAPYKVQGSWFALLEHDIICLRLLHRLFQNAPLADDVLLKAQLTVAVAGLGSGSAWLSQKDMKPMARLVQVLNKEKRILWSKLQKAMSPYGVKTDALTMLVRVLE